MIRVDGSQLIVDTKTLVAVFDRGSLTSLRSKATGEEFIRPSSPGRGPALELVYGNGDVIGLDLKPYGSIRSFALSSHHGEVVFEGWDGDGLLAISEDLDNGDLIVEPSAYSSRPGVLSCRWNVRGVRRDLEVCAPLYQGVKMSLDDELLRNTRWEWPYLWEAGLVILQGPKSGFWTHTQDATYRYKALQLGAPNDPHVVGLDSEAYGPIDANLSAGGVTWRLNVHEGDWKVPAARYRKWLWDAHGLGRARQNRPDWVDEVGLAVCWCPVDVDLLNALAERVDPRKCLLHVPRWRTDPYDENYPTYQATEEAKGFIGKAQQLGFRSMPHFNAIDMDPNHPVYPRVRDFEYRHVSSKRVQGWTSDRGQWREVPESNAARLLHRDKKVMVKIHPGLSMWRSLLGRSILDAARELRLDGVFVDVTLCLYNVHQCLVEATTPAEGMQRLIEHVARLGEGLVVGGEGLNEITMQGLSFAQAHLFNGGRDVEGLERTGGCALNHFLWGDLCRTIGYTQLSGQTEEDRLRMRLHAEHGAIPTITVSSATEIIDPNDAVRQALSAAC